VLSCFRLAQVLGIAPCAEAAKFRGVCHRSLHLISASLRPPNENRNEAGRYIGAMVTALLLWRSVSEASSELSAGPMCAVLFRSGIANYRRLGM
jgi:hypothetical protein